MSDVCFNRRWRPEWELWDGRSFLIILWCHRGFYDKEIARALGITTARVTQIRHKLFREFGEKCGFFRLPVRINKRGKPYSRDMTFGGLISPFYLEKAQ